MHHEDSSWCWSVVAVYFIESWEVLYTTSFPGLSARPLAMEIQNDGIFSRNARKHMMGCNTRHYKGADQTENGASECGGAKRMTEPHFIYRECTVYMWSTR